jgi:hypothetical protein
MLKERLESIRPVGKWLSLVEHLVRDQEVAGSNPVFPTGRIDMFRKKYKIRKNAITSLHSIDIGENDEP